MIRKLKKRTAGLILACVIAVLSPAGGLLSWAADAKISFDDPSVMVGNEVTVNMKVASDSPLGTAEIMLAYDPNILEFVSGTSANGGAGVIKVLGTMDSADQKAFSFSLKFKTLQAGNAQISVTSQEIYDLDSQVMSLSRQGSSSVKITPPATYSKDAALKSLKISPGTLTPEFSPSVDSYTAEVDASTANLVVNALAAHAGAHVSLQGEKGLKGGENQVVVKVTAEDGQTVKNYTINVTKAEGGDTDPAAEGSSPVSEAEFGAAAVTIDGTQYSIALSFDEASLPEGFESVTYSYKGMELMAGKGLEKDLLLLYLKDSGGNSGFYIYKEESDTWIQFVQLRTNAKAIILLPLDIGTDVPDGFRVQKEKINGIQVTCWVENSEAEPQYYLFYGMNWNGEKHFYRYDISEETIQRYFPSGVSNSKFVSLSNTFDQLTRDYYRQFYILIALSALSLGLLVAVIVLVKRNSSGQNRPEKGFPADGQLRDDPKEAALTSTIKKYSREEFDNDNSGAVDPGQASEEIKEAEEIKIEQELKEEDDFLEEASLEDLEQTLPSSEAEELIKEEDDFEFLNLEE